MKLVITNGARRDQDAISRYTLERWGRAQLHSYVGGLLDKMDELAANPRKNRTVVRLPSRFLRASYGSHFVFYSVIDDEVRIVRILHQRMDAARHLP